MRSLWDPFFEPRLVECPTCHQIIRGGPGNMNRHAREGHPADLETLRDDPE